MLKAGLIKALQRKGHCQRVIQLWASVPKACFLPYLMQCSKRNMKLNVIFPRKVFLVLQLCNWSCAMKINWVNIALGPTNLFGFVIWKNVVLLFQPPICIYNQYINTNCSVLSCFFLFVCFFVVIVVYNSSFSYIASITGIEKQDSSHFILLLHMFKSFSAGVKTITACVILISEPGTFWYLKVLKNW